MTEKRWIETPEPGIYPAKDVPAELYHSWDAMSASWLGILDTTSPKAFHHKRRFPDPPTAAMQFGEMLHVLVLEPFDFGARFELAPDCDKRTKAGKKAWAECEARADGRSIVPRSGPGSYGQARAMAHAIEEHPLAPKVLQSGLHEASLVWVDEETGVKCKARLDALNPPAVGDVKSTLNAHPAQFEKAIWNFGYHRQAAIYLDALAALGREDVTDFVFVAVEKSAPYDVIVRPAGESVIAAGRMAYKRALFTYKKCRETDTWPGYDGADGNLTPLELPEWALREEGLVQ